MKAKLLMLSGLFWSGVAIADKPNFLFILSDDQDWTGLSVQVHPDLENSKSAVYQTPSIAKLASEGMRFSAAYAPAPVCSPTRISLQTGMSPAQLHWTKAAPTMGASAGYKLISPTLRKRIRTDETTIAELLKSAGYATAHYGKWHIGGGGPERHGYDESDGDTGNGDAAPFKGDNPVDIFGMGRRAAAFMEKSAKAGKSFFIQISHHALHYPENANPKTIEKYRKLGGGNTRGLARAAITEDLDTGVGELLRVVDALGLRGTTYVIYMSDNGGGGKDGRRPVQGGKGSVWEGGIRVPLIIRGPEIKANSWCRERVVGFDLLPTLCELGGVKKALPKGIEGGSFAHLLTGSTKPVKRSREELVFHFPHYQGDTPHSSIFLGDYKAIKFYESGEVKLFEIEKDIGERNNLARKMPEKAAEMEKRLMAYLKTVHAQLPEKNPRAVAGKEYSKGGGGKGGRERGKRGGERRPRGEGRRPRE
mgnify:CR=1 FL=1